MTLVRYLVSQFLSPFLFGLSLFSGVLLLDKIFDLVDLLVNKGVSLVISAKMFALFLPTVVSLSAPMALLLACLLTFGKLSEDHEILALRASGMSFRQILWPPLLVALLLSLGLLPFNTILTPRAMVHFRTLVHRISSTDPLIQLEPRRFLAVQNMRLFAERVGADHRTLTGVWLYRLFPDSTQRIYAARGTAEVGPGGLSLTLRDGQIHRHNLVDPKDFIRVAFEEYRLNVTFQAPLDARNRSRREMSIRELRDEIARRIRLGLSPGEPASELHLRFALAFAPLALALVGIPLGITLERGGKGVGFGAAVAVLFAYYLLLILGMNLAERDALPAGPALWLANAGAAAAGFALFRWRLS